MFQDLDQLTEAIGNLGEDGKRKLREIPGDYLLETGARSIWLHVREDGAVTVRKEPAEKALCTVRAAEDDLLAIVNGKLSPARALLFGKLKISGDKLKLLKLIQSL